jgi:hypothetical protein
MAETVKDLFTEAAERTLGPSLYGERAAIQEQVDAAGRVQVTDLESCLFAENVVKELEDGARKWKARLEDARKNSYAAWKSITNTIALADPMEEAARKLGRRCYEWRNEQKRIAREAEERRQAAERKRIEDERLAQAERLAAQGKTERADAVLAAPVQVAAQEVAKPQATEDISYRENWVGRVVDANLLPHEYLMPDLSKLTKVTKALKGQTSIPGWECWDAGSTVVKGKR